MISFIEKPSQGWTPCPCMKYCCSCWCGYCNICCSGWCKSCCKKRRSQNLYDFVIHRRRWIYMPWLFCIHCGYFMFYKKGQFCTISCILIKHKRGESTVARWQNMNGKRRESSRANWSRSKFGWVFCIKESSTIWWYTKINMYSVLILYIRPSLGPIGLNKIT